MNEQVITIAICLGLGLLLVLFPRPIAAWFCRYMKDLWRLHGNAWFGKGLGGAVWIIERVSLGRVHDEATAPKAFRFAGFMYLWVAFWHWFVFFLLYPAGWSEREAAVQPRQQSDVSGGCFPSLTLSVGPIYDTPR